MIIPQTEDGVAGSPVGGKGGAADNPRDSGIIANLVCMEVASYFKADVKAFQLPGDVEIIQDRRVHREMIDENRLGARL